IPVQVEVGAGGTTDATAIHLERGGIPSTTLSITTRYIHSPVEVVDPRDIEAGVQLLVEALKTKPRL
ncbi:MAG TPA: M42 family peptidase, partial [Methanoregulaceae archaeon]|nr:M42 family peptidase [Methanoregulaceae archaeon]